MSEGEISAFVFTAFPFVFFCVWGLVGTIVHFASGWDRLLKIYPADRTVGLDWRRFRTGRVGYGGWRSARFGNVLELAIDAEALYLRPFLPFRLLSKTLRIPFSEASNEVRRFPVFGWYVLTPVAVPDVKIALTLKDGRWIDAEAARLRGGPSEG